MQISEARLRQVIIEEVRVRLIEMYVDQEIDKLIREDETDDEYDAAKWKARRKKARNIALGALGMGVGVGGLKMATDQHADTKAAEREMTQQINIEKSSTVERSVQDLNKQAGNFYSWTWKTNDAQTLPFPTNPDNNSEAILPPEWSVVAQVAKDKEAGTPQYEVDQIYLKTADSPDALAAVYKDIKGSGAPEAASDFFDRFSPDSHPFSDASEMGAHGFASNNPGVPSAMIDLDSDGAPDRQNLVYIPFDELPDDYVMPNSGLTKEQMYKKYYYGHGMSLEEFKKLKGSLKENKITWKNYKNRKKMLA